MLSWLPHQGAKVLPSSSRARRRQERAWRQWPGPSRPFASPAPGYAIGAPISPIAPLRCRPASASSRFGRHLPRLPQRSASILPPYAAPLLGRSRPGLLFLRRLRKKSPVLPLQGRVQPGRYSSRHFGPAAKASGLKEPSGRPGHGRPGRWRFVYSPLSRIQRLSRKYTKRRWEPSVPGLTAASLLPSFREWAVPAQAPEGVCPPTASVFVGGREPKVSRPWSRQSPLHPHAARHPPGPRSTRFARSAPYVTGRLTAATHKPPHTPGSCETASNIGPQETHARTASSK